MNHLYLKSRSDLRVFSNQCPFQILRSMADLVDKVRACVSIYNGQYICKTQIDDHPLIDVQF
jgi:hypothetical protein